MRFVYIAFGWSMVVVGIIGAFLPVLPTTPFLLLAAWAFARSSPRLEAWLLNHKTFGSLLRDWRERGAISRKGKVAALVAFACSAIVALFFAPMPWKLIPLAAAAIGGTWIWTRPE